MNKINNMKMGFLKRTYNGRMKRKTNKAEAITQILILVIGIVAISWMIGGEVRVVSADVGDCGGTCVVQGSCSGTVNLASTSCNEKVCCVPKTEQEDSSNKFLEGIIPGVITTVVSTAASVGTTAIMNNALGPQISPSLSTSGLKPGLLDPNVPLTPGTTPPTIDPKTGFKISKIFKAKIGKISVGKIITNAMWAATTAIIISYVAKKFASERNAADLKTVAWIGAGVGTIATTLMGVFGVAGPLGLIAAGITAVFAGVYMVVGYQDYSKELFTFSSKLWQPVSGGASCSKCNELKYGCSEYLCHSYGAACDWKNTETEYETCIEINKGDKKQPIITPLKNVYEENVFPNDKYSYTTSAAGTKIKYSEDTKGCVPPFSSITIALETDEPAHCRIVPFEPINGADAKTIFGLMKDMAEGTSYTKNHTVRLPSSVTASQSAMKEAGYVLTNGGDYPFYVRCDDIQGNINSMDYLFFFCVQTGPDTDPPEITGTKPPQNYFMPYDEEETPIEIYTNEPADCKWDLDRKSYEFMSFEFDKCSKNLNDKISGEFGCKGTLTGIEKNKDSEYYIACIDKPELAGTDKESERNKGAIYELVLKGTDELIVKDVAINGGPNETTIKDSIPEVKVNIEIETFGGAEEGKSRCKYSTDKTEPREYYFFNNERSREYLYKNTHSLYLPAGIHEYFIHCEDSAGNVAETMINFTIEVDNTPPTVVRIYKEDEEESYLKIITDETGECVYSSSTCTYLFEDGVKMTDLGKEHYTPWNINTDFYIKCRDERKIGPDLTECSIVARPFEIFEVQ